MKKLSVLILLIIMIFLSSCKKEPVIEDVIPCTDIQIEVDGECIDLTGQQIQLRNVLENTQEITNYELLVTITENEIQYEIMMMFDDNKSAIQTLNQIDYYTDYFGVCEHLTVMNEVIIISSADCNTDDTYLFFKNFDYTWFSVIDGRYSLNQENYTDIEEFFLETFPSSSLESFTMSATEAFIADMILELSIDDEIYIIELVISSIDQVDLALPGGE